MFPEIVRDDIFRLETRRLWLQWPTATDADATDRTQPPRGLGPGGSMQGLSGKCPVGADEIEAWRSEMECGAALHLMLVLKGNERDAVGSVHVAPIDTGHCGLHYGLDDAYHGAGLMTEAVQSAVDAAFLLGGMKEISASPAVLDPGGRRVLERCGFTYLGNGMRANRSGRGLVACDHFRLERKTWSSLKGWSLPGLMTGAALPGGRPSTSRQEPCLSA